MSTKKKNRGKKPLRICVSCGQENPKSEMMRIVVSGRNTEAKEKTYDETGRSHGRGAYICRKEKCVEKAFNDGLIDDELRDITLKEIERYRIQMISLAMKAGKLASGEFQCEEAVKQGKAGVVIIAEDASENTEKKFINKCEYYNIPYIKISDKASLGNAIGKNERSVVAITDEEFSAHFKKLFGGN